MSGCSHELYQVPAIIHVFWENDDKWGLRRTSVLSPEMPVVDCKADLAVERTTHNNLQP